MQAVDKRVEEMKELYIDAKQLVSNYVENITHGAGDPPDLSRRISYSGGRRTSYAMARGNYMKPEIADEEVDYTRKLNSFQRQKIEAWFDILFDVDNDGYLTKLDMELTAQRLAQNADWAPDSEEATATKDALRSILEAFLDTTHKNINDGKISKKEFLNYFGKHCQDVASVNQFPYQVQLIPRILFSAIGRGKKELTQADLAKFYHAFLPKEDAMKYSQEDLDAYSKRAYRAFTGNGEIPLTMHVYGLVFSNFLLGRSQQTPGKYILPCFDVDGKLDAKRYVIDWNAAD